MIIQLRLDSRYVSGLDRLLKERQKQHPAYCDAIPPQAPMPLRKRPPGSIAITLKKTSPDNPPESSR